MGGVFDVVIPGVDIPGGAMGSGTPAGGEFDIEIPGIT
jgi:hypothetical protein